MKNKPNIYQILSIEAAVLLIALILSFMFIGPYLYYGIRLPFYWYNLLFIFVFVVFFKHIFFLQYSFIDSYQKLKMLIIPCSFIFVFVLIRMLSKFAVFVDTFALAEFMTDLPYKERVFLSKLFKNQYVFFAVGAILASFVLPIRLIVSVWREVNR